MMCLGASIYEATLHGDETLLLPAVDRWRALTGFYPAILPLWSPFDLDLPAPRGNGFPADWLLQGLRERRIEPAIFAHSADEPGWATHGYEAILRGERDEALERWGLQAAAYGHRLVFRWDQEMNGRFPWSLREPAEYIRVFRHVSQRIRHVAGARNVEFFFCPSLRGQDSGLDIIESYYPGDEWCQHVGFDGFSRTEQWTPLAEQWGPTVRRLERMTERPIVVGEFGRRVDLPQRDEWLASLGDVRGVSAAIYFDMNLTFFDWPGHHWLMGGPMRKVYASLPRCRPLVEEPTEGPLPEPSAEPFTSPSPEPSPAPSLEGSPEASLQPSPVPDQTPGASAAPRPSPTAHTASPASGVDASRASVEDTSLPRRHTL